MPGTRSFSSQTHLQGVKFRCTQKNSCFSQYPKASVSLSEKSWAVPRPRTPRLKGKLPYSSQSNCTEIMRSSSKFTSVFVALGGKAALASA